ncbi:hypothetical protein BLNAU_23880 [Blattamonas nauphoetae]|uniref:Uncharacterized protein n=1 Tax=Blattamonas nauphoetae TaxID=2049346 RepID=A0ABQ9WP09_9EUKA|nr:hypothetical protein BLNAU_23880 [Blattamonas nauphoetae]
MVSKLRSVIEELLSILLLPNPATIDFASTKDRSTTTPAKSQTARSRFPTILKITQPPSQSGQPGPSKLSEREASKDDTLIDFGDMQLDMSSSQKQGSPTTQPEQSNTDLMSPLFGSFVPGPTHPNPRGETEVDSLLVVAHTNALHPTEPDENVYDFTDGWESDLLHSTHAEHCCSGAGWIHQPAHPHLLEHPRSADNEHVVLPPLSPSFFSVPSPAPSSEIYNNMWNQFKQQPNCATHKIISTRSPLNPALLQSIIGLLQSTYHFHLLPGYSSNKQVICLVSALPLKNKTPIPVLLTLQPHGQWECECCFDYASPSAEVVNGLSDWMIGQISDL